MFDPKVLLKGAERMTEAELKDKLKIWTQVKETERSESNKDLAHRIFRGLLVVMAALLVAGIGWLFWRHVQAGDADWVQNSIVNIAGHVATAIGSVNGWPWIKNLVKSEKE